MEWLFAALNSVEMASLPWSLFQFSGDTAETPGRKLFDDFLGYRLDRMEPVLAGREWLAGTFSVADILMSDVLRLVDRFDGLAEHPACRAYVARATARPAFAKAHADQMAHFAAADWSRAAGLEYPARPPAALRGPGRRCRRRRSSTGAGRSSQRSDRMRAASPLGSSYWRCRSVQTKAPRPRRPRPSDTGTRRIRMSMSLQT